MSNKKIEQQLAPLFEVIKTTKPDWEVRRNAMLKIKDIITNPEYANADWNALLQQSYLVCLADQMKDNRSNIVVTAADLIDTISTLGNSISDRAHLLAVYCLDRVGSGNTIIKQNCQRCTKTLYQNVVMKKGISTLQQYSTSANENVRITCYDCLYIITTVWPVETYYMNSDVLNMTINGISASLSLIRERSRDIYSVLKENCPNMAEAIYSQLDSITQSNFEKALLNRTSKPSLSDPSSEAPSFVTPSKPSMGSLRKPYVTKSQRGTSIGIQRTGTITPRSGSRYGSSLNSSTYKTSLRGSVLNTTIESEVSEEENKGVSHAKVPSINYTGYYNPLTASMTAPILSLEESNYKSFEQKDNISLNSRVKFTYQDKNEVGYGTVRYIGYIPNHSNIFCGIEADKVHPKGGTGIIGSIRFFTTTPGRAVFFKLSSVTPVDNEPAPSLSSLSTLVNNFPPSMFVDPVFIREDDPDVQESEFIKLTGDHRVVIKDTLDDLVDHLNALNEVLPNVQNVDMQRDYVTKTRLSLQRMIEEYKALLEQFNQYNV